MPRSAEGAPSDHATGLDPMTRTTVVRPSGQPVSPGLLRMTTLSSLTGSDLTYYSRYFSMFHMIGSPKSITPLSSLRHAAGLENWPAIRKVPSS